VGNSKLFGLILCTAFAGCSSVGSLFGGSDRVDPANTIASDGSSPLAERATYLAGSTSQAFFSTQQLLDTTEAATSLSGVVAERSNDGFILRGTALASSQGYTKPVLVRDPEAYEKDPSNPVYLVRLTPPSIPQPVGNAVNRQVVFAGFISAEDAASIRNVTLKSAQNQSRLRLR